MRVTIEVNSTYWIKGIGWVTCGKLVNGTLEAWKKIELHDKTSGKSFKAIVTSSYGKSGEKTFVSPDFIGLQLINVTEDDLPLEGCILEK